MNPVVAIVGPTGSGKSDLGLKIARTFGGEILNCDSVQVYRGLDVGSAKTPPAGQFGIPHHLLDIIAPTEELTAGAYSRLARVALHQVIARGSLPVVVGGTGLYLRAFFEGLSPAPERDAAVRDRLRQAADAHPQLLHRFLRRYDPSAASRIHANDHQKLIRAVELTLKGGRPATAIQQQSRDALPGVNLLKIGLNPDRQQCYERLNGRTAAMFKNGLLQETRDLLDSGIPPDAKPLQTLGYKQAVEVLRQRLSETEAIEQCRTKTRQYAKRQLTWFRHDPDVQWLSGFGFDPQIQQQATALCRSSLGLI